MTGSYEAKSDCSVIWKLQDDSGGFQVESDCSVRFGLTLSARYGRVAEPSPMTMRGFLVNGGKEILAFQTDPGTMVSARFTSDAR